MILTFLNRYRDAGLLLLRIGVGLYLALGHGWGKISGGPEAWTQIGQATGLIGIGFLPAFWGFMSAFAEFVCSLLVVLGLLFRPALILIVLNMAMAATRHIVTGQGSPELALIYGIVFLSLLFIGPGRYSIDAFFTNQRRHYRHI